MKGKEQFIYYVNQFVSPNIEQMNEFYESFTFQEVKKNDFLINSGELCVDVWFVLNGILRHYLVDNNQEGTVWFSFSNDIVTEINSLISQQPTVHNIIAVTDCKLLKISRENLEAFYAKDCIWERFGRLTTTYYLLRQMERVNDLIFKNGMDKYEDFILKHPEVQNAVPLNQIAEYIGLSKETLSRIRGKRI
jgi:CRP-like cAMP-binding protein